MTGAEARAIEVEPGEGEKYVMEVMISTTTDDHHFLNSINTPVRIRGCQPSFLFALLNRHGCTSTPPSISTLAFPFRQ